MKAGLAKFRRKPRPAKEVRGTRTKEAIVRAALDLIDRNGIEDFSVRNVAKMLNVFPTAIYWHIEGRNRLLGDALALVRPRRGP